MRSQIDNILRRNSSVALTSISFTPNILICKNDMSKDNDAWLLQELI